MRIERRFLVPHLHAAAADQLVSELRAQGYAVDRDVRIDGSPGQPVEFDVVAKRGEEAQFYQIKVFGDPRQPAAARLRDLAAAARRSGGSFRLLVVRPDRSVDVSVSGLEQALGHALAADPAQPLAALGQGVRVEAISSLDLSRLDVHGGGAVEAMGTAVASLSLPPQGEAVAPARGAIAIRFHIALDGNGAVRGQPEPSFELDHAQWNGWDDVA